MKLRQILTASIALALGHTALAADPTFGKAQPITLAAAAGLDQSDFHLLRNKLTSSLFFTAVTKEIAATKKVGAKEVITYYAQHVETGVNNHFFLADRFAPLLKKASVTVPAGTILDNFLFNSNQINSQVVQGAEQEFFHVPTKGLYYSNGGGAPIIVKPETVAAPLSGDSMNNPTYTANNKDHTLQFRIVFGAKDPKKGYMPYISQGSSATDSALKTPSGALLSNPSCFTTYVDPDGATGNRAAFFVAQDSSGQSGIYKLTVDTGKPTPKYGATLVTNMGIISPSALVGCNTGLLFIDDNGDGTHGLYVFNNDQSSYTFSDGAGSEPQDLTRKVIEGREDETDDGIGYTSVDPMGRRRFSACFNIGTPHSIFTDSTASYVDPVHITGSGDYYYYGATAGSFQYALKDFYGSQDDVFPLRDVDGNYLVNPTEFCLVGTSGNVYFVADAVSPVGDPVSEKVLYYNDGSDTTLVSNRVTDLDGNEIVKAHNLRSIADGSIFRLYFSAPINGTDNSAQLPKDKNGQPIRDKHGNLPDYASKPWVVNDLQ